MQFLLKADQIKSRLLLLKRSYNPNHSLPALTGILFEAKKNNLVTLRVTDLYLGVNLKVKAQVKQPGMVVIQGQQLLDILSSLSPEENLSFKLSKEEKNVLIETSKIKVKLPIFNPDDFPEFPEVESDGVILSLNQIKFINEYVVSHASLDKTRPILTGVFFNFNHDNLVVAATDGYRLAATKIKHQGKNKVKLIIPAKIITDLEKTMLEEEVTELVFMTDFTQYQARCMIGETEVYIRLIEGEYPPYEKIIPQDFNLKVNFDSQEVLPLLKQARIFAKNNSNIIQLKVDKGEVGLVVDSSNSGSYQATLKAETKGSGFNIAFNIDYVIDIFQKAKGELVVMQAVESLKPARFSLDGRDDLEYVIMPIKVHNA